MGTENIKKMLDELLEAVESGYKTFSDGFQFGDIFKLIGIGKDLFDFTSLIPDAKPEYKDLDAEEVNNLVDYFSEKGLEKLSINFNGTHNLGTTSIKSFINDAGVLTANVIEALEDGKITVDDLIYLPGTSKAVGGMIFAFPKMWEEAGDLTREEFADVLGDLAREIFKAFDN